MKGSIELWFGLVGLILFGFLATFMSVIFSEIGGSYNTTIQLILMFAVPFMGLILIYGIIRSH